jgi:translation initiation factor eIF-2B subunit epsilon
MNYTQDIRNDFIRNQAVNWEVGKHIFSYQLNNEYAARVLDPRTYHAICRDIVTRWVHPIVPDANIMQDYVTAGGGGYTHLRRYVYKEPGVKVHRSATVGEGVVMGSGTNIEAGSNIERSIIGRNCHIGTGRSLDASQFANASLFPIYRSNNHRLAHLGQLKGGSWC